MGIDVKMQPAARQALQEAVEALVINVYQNSILCAVHGKRVTVSVPDMRLYVSLLSVFCFLNGVSYLSVDRIKDG